MVLNEVAQCLMSFPPCLAFFFSLVANVYFGKCAHLQMIAIMVGIGVVIVVIIIGEYDTFLLVRELVRWPASAAAAGTLYHCTEHAVVNFSCCAASQKV